MNLVVGDYRKCDSKEDCYNHTSTSIPETLECLDFEGRGFSTCYCVDHLKEADRDGVCDISRTCRVVTLITFVICITLNVVITF